MVDADIQSLLSILVTPSQRYIAALCLSHVTTDILSATNHVTTDIPSATSHVTTVRIRLLPMNSRGPSTCAKLGDTRVIWGLRWPISRRGDQTSVSMEGGDGDTNSELCVP